MALLCPDVGEAEFLKRMFYSSAAAENLTLKLRTDGVTPGESDTAGTYTEATFTGYVTKTLTSTQSGSTWGVPATSVGVTSITYGTVLSWTASSSQTITGYFVVGASSGTLYWAENFGSSKSLTSGDSLSLTVVFKLD